MPEADPNATSTKFAGKYDTPEALEQGIREATKTLGLPDIGEAKIIGGVYKDAAIAETAYKALESLIGKTKTPQATTTTTANPQSTTTPKMEIKADDEGIEQVLTKAGLKGDELAQQWSKDGKLTDDQYAKFKAQGYPKQIVDSIMHGHQATAALNVQAQTAARTRATEIAGGDQQLSNLLAFAGSLPANRVADLNERLGDPNRFEGAVKELMFEHTQALGAGNARPLIENTQGGGGSGATKPTTMKEFKALGERAARGDASAAAIITNLSMAEMNALN